MTVTSFASPFDVQDAIIVCLAAAFTAEEWEALLIHTGSVGTGQPVDCCPSGSLRVEAGTIVANDDRGRRWLARPNGCMDLQQIFVVTYRQCYQSQTSQGRTKKPVDLEAQARELEARGWAAVLAMACCSDYVLNFVSLTYDPIEACAGYTLTVDATVKVCASQCVPGTSTFMLPSRPSQSIAIGVAGEGSST